MFSEAKVTEIYYMMNVFCKEYVCKLLKHLSPKRVSYKRN